MHTLTQRSTASTHGHVGSLGSYFLINDERKTVDSYSQNGLESECSTASGNCICRKETGTLDTSCRVRRALQIFRVPAQCSFLKQTLFSGLVFFLKNSFKDVIYFLERGREKERERNINVWLPLAGPLLGTWLTTRACALTRH